jgi:large subunit ribosomal protein L21
MAKVAIIETGGKQYIATEGAVFSIEKVDAAKGQKIEFSNVLMTDDGSRATIGTPLVAGATVSAEVIEQDRDDKVTVIRYRPKSRYFKKRGHRQPYTSVKILSL